MTHILRMAAVLTCLAVPAGAASVNLNTWSQNDFKATTGTNAPGNWSVQAGNDTVTQTLNGAPTVFFDGTSTAQGQALNGTIRVNTSNDDDWVGFVLGYSNGEFDSTSADFWLIDWSQSNNSIGTSVPTTRGLALSHVSGNTQTLMRDQIVTRDGAVTEVQRANTLGTTGWGDGVEYDFELVFTSTLIEVFVDGTSELRHTSADNGGAFTDGSFGFYNFSQGDVTYGSVGIETAPVPVPASLPLLALGLGALGLARRRAATRAEG